MKFTAPQLGLSFALLVAGMLLALFSVLHVLTVPHLALVLFFLMLFALLLP